MEYIEQQDESVYGPFGGPREYSEAEGRFNGGGWISGPMAGSDFDGRGVWMPAPPRDGEKNGGAPSPHMGAYGNDEIFDMARGWAGDPAAEGGWF